MSTYEFQLPRVSWPFMYFSLHVFTLYVNKCHTVHRDSVWCGENTRTVASFPKEEIHLEVAQVSHQEDVQCSWFCSEGWGGLSLQFLEAKPQHGLMIIELQALRRVTQLLGGREGLWLKSLTSQTYRTSWRPLLRLTLKLWYVYSIEPEVTLQSIHAVTHVHATDTHQCQPPLKMNDFKPPHDRLLIPSVFNKSWWS